MNVINSLPESFATAILTAAFTGVLLFYFRKRIENSFGEKMEAFRTKLQQSLYENQVKFSTVHANRIETLHTLFKKLVAYSRGFNRINKHINQRYNSVITESDLTIVDYEKLGEKLTDFQTYLIENSLHLPDEITEKIEYIYKTVESFHEVLDEMFPFHRKEYQSSEFLIRESLVHIDWVKKKYTESELAILEYPDFYMILSHGMKELLKDLEDLYKSVAEAKSEEQ